MHVRRAMNSELSVIARLDCLDAKVSRRVSELMSTQAEPLVIVNTPAITTPEVKHGTRNGLAIWRKNTTFDDQWLTEGRLIAQDNTHWRVSPIEGSFGN